eukprot:CAMPEP_0170586684 /NCGR_PEP_ID=MMETSP0224-20130122/9876_1 /TAXON_ID=285029 /ORGANISM="Togula jolla, Strain CCCM 725" /LENGTH=323 /DNA_ID=CAMNT_0010910247 /DNA_START=45 /DNA_END=1016 /DNA_ORIENTATION=-
MDRVSIAPTFSGKKEPMRLVWRSTFINAEAPLEPWGKSLKSFSEPTAAACMSVSTEFVDEQVYVQNLAERACQLLRSTGVSPTLVSPPKLKLEDQACPVPQQSYPLCINRDIYSSGRSTVASFSDATDAKSSYAEVENSSHFTDTWSTPKAATDSASFNELDCPANPGSLGHPHLCERICHYEAEGRCISGIDCNFCHMPHAEKQVHLDKRNRRMIQAMSYYERAAILLPILEQKAQENDFGPACELLLSLLAKEASAHEGTVPQLPKNRLARATSSMSFHTVLVHLVHGLPRQATLSVDDVQILTQAMRVHVANRSNMQGLS